MQIHTNKNPSTGFSLILCGLLFFVFIISCGEDTYAPKPHGYFRIQLPEKAYRSYDTTFPYTFNYPEYAKISFDKYTQREPFWLNIDFPQFKGRIHLSYKNVKGNNLYNLMEDSRNMVFKHAPKALGIRESVVIDDERRVYGMVYGIEGRDAASPFQFYLTDSTDHFLRGSLYFNVVPNNDSLEPVIEFIIQDIDEMIKTLSWK
nr:gliding motility lipoprotein GldD [Bacteroidota bacterium]